MQYMLAWRYTLALINTEAAEAKMYLLSNVCKQESASEDTTGIDLQ